MQELTPREFKSSLSDEANLAAVEYYQSATDEKMLQLAASIHSQPGKQDPGETLNQAEELVLGTIGAAKSLRLKLLRCMNRNTLQELAGRLLDHDALFEYEYVQGKEDIIEELEKNPITGPVIAVLKQRGLFPQPADFRNAEMLRSAKAGTAVPYPELPCSLDVALRWAADAPDIPIKTLNRAFFDWTATIVHVPNMRVKSLEKYQSSFAPGATKTPKKLAAHVKAYIKSIFEVPHLVKLESHLLYFATDFRPFWKKHASAYKQLAKEKSSKNKSSGEGGPIAAKKKDLQEKTDAFVRFCDGRIIPATGSDEWDDFFSEFANPLYKDPRTNKKIAAFMKTLLVHVTENMSDGEIKAVILLLNKEGIIAVNSDTIRSCMDKLKGIAAT